MHTKSILLTILFITGISFQNCNQCDCCFDPAPEYFDIQAMSVEQLDINGAYIEDSSIAFRHYGFLRLFFDVEYIAHWESDYTNFSLINSAYGCTPIEAGSLGSKEEAIESLEIITVFDFDEAHLAGSSINDLLEIINVDAQPVLLSDFLENYTENIPRVWLDFKLLKQPELSNDFQVNINLELSTGESYEGSSELIGFE